ncbi:MAG: EAL domain-containing protein [Nitrospirae bacterium]|nr:EAL domain-containing protein [Nitrospirota bacterium]
MDKALLLDNILNSSVDIAITATDLDFKIRYYNPKAEEIYGYKPEEIIGKTVMEVHSKEKVTHGGFAPAMDKVRTKGEYSYTYKRKSGNAFRYVESRVTGIWNNEKNLVGYVLMSRDVTHRKEADMALQRLIDTDRLKADISSNFVNVSIGSIIEEINVSIGRVGKFLEVDHAYVFIDVENLTHAYEWCNHAVKPHLDLVRGFNENSYPWLTRPWLTAIVRGGELFSLSGIGTIADKANRLELMALDIKSMVVSPMVYGGEVIGFLWLITAISERTWSEEDLMLIKMTGEIFVNAIMRKKSEDRLKQLAHFDTLTRIPNRMLFNDRLNHSLESAKRGNARLALLFLDLDRFKPVNDTLGHDVGDMLLKEVARRLLECLRKSDTVARLGGDEFSIILTNVTKDEDASNVASKIISSLSNPFYLNGNECTIGVSVGISMFPTDGTDAGQLLKAADIAMYQVKEQGRNSYQFYSNSMNKKAVRKLKIETMLRKAFEKQEFRVYYQPQVDINNGHMKGMEGLLHWDLYDETRVTPAEFIGTAEVTGLVFPIGQWMLREVCEQNKTWHRSGFNHLQVAVKILHSQFRQERLIEFICKVLDETGFDPRYLEIELTESAIMQDVDSAVNILRQMKSIGLQITIDDFGTGYSSLSHIKRLPIDTLKIDKQFVKNITTDPDYSAIARAIIALAHTLNLKVIAEGVETLDQLEFLRTIRCDEVQGALFSLPMPSGGITALLNEERNFSVPRPA